MKKERLAFGTWFLSIVGCVVIVITTVASAQGFAMMDGTYTITCRDGSSRTCNGDRCVGEDNNACRCTNNNGSVDLKTCPTVYGGGGPVPAEPPQG